MTIQSLRSCSRLTGFTVLKRFCFVACLQSRPNLKSISNLGNLFSLHLSAAKGAMSFVKVYHVYGYLHGLISVKNTGL